MKTIKAFLLFACALAIGPAAAFDDVQVTYRGRLWQNAAPPTRRSVNMTFRLYAEKGAEVPLWTSDEMTVALDAQGLFQTALRGAGLAGALDAGATWVGVMVNGGKEQYPRQELLASPYAAKAARADALAESASVKTAAVKRVEAKALLVSTLDVSGEITLPQSSVVSVAVDMQRGNSLLPVRGSVKFFSRAAPRDLGTKTASGGGCSFGAAGFNCAALFMATGTDVMPAMSLFFKKGETVAVPSSAGLPNGVTVRCLVYPIGVE